MNFAVYVRISVSVHRSLAILSSTARVSPSNSIRNGSEWDGLNIPGSWSSTTDQDMTVTTFGVFSVHKWIEIWPKREIEARITEFRVDLCSSLAVISSLHTVVTLLRLFLAYSLLLVSLVTSKLRKSVMRINQIHTYHG